MLTAAEAREIGKAQQEIYLGMIEDKIREAAEDGKEFVNVEAHRSGIDEVMSILEAHDYTVHFSDPPGGRRPTLRISW